METIEASRPATDGAGSADSVGTTPGGGGGNGGGGGAPGFALARSGGSGASASTVTTGGPDALAAAALHEQQQAQQAAQQQQQARAQLPPAPLVMPAAPGGGGAAYSAVFQVPAGHALVQVGPGLFALQPAAPAAPGPAAPGPAAAVAAPPLHAPASAAQFGFGGAFGAPAAPVPTAAAAEPAAAPAVAQPPRARSRSGVRRKPATAAAAAAPTAAAAPAGAVTAAAAAAAPAPTEKRRGPSQRFRDRQIALISSLESMVADKLRALRLLARENERLKHKAGVLEAAVRGRESQMRVIEDAGGVNWGGGGGGAGGCGANGGNAASGSVASGGGGVGGNGGGASSSAADGASGGCAACSSGSGGGACADCGDCGASACDSGGGPRLSAQAAAPSPPAAAPGDCAVAACAVSACAEEGACTAEQQKACINRIKHMGFGEVKAHWRAFLSEVSKELMALDAQEETAAAAAAAAPPPPAAANGDCAGPCASRPPVRGGALERIHTAVARHMFVVKHVALLNPGAMYQLLGVNLETGAPQPAAPAFWAGVVRELRLTLRQLADLETIYEIYSRRAAAVAAEREALHAQLARCGGGGGGEEGGGSGAAAAGGGDGGNGAAAAPPGCTACERLSTLEALARTYRKEHTMRLLLNCSWASRIVTPVQLSRAAVLSFPLFPDTHAIIVAALEGAAAAKAAAGAANGAAAAVGAAPEAAAAAAAAAPIGSGGGVVAVGRPQEVMAAAFSLP